MVSSSPIYPLQPTPLCPGFFTIPSSTFSAYPNSKGYLQLAIIMSAHHLALRATNYTSVHDAVNAAPSCAESCLEAFWERIIDVCDNDHDWPCLCSYGPAGEWTQTQQTEWVQVADRCIAADCPSAKVAGVQDSRTSFTAFCANYRK